MRKVAERNQEIARALESGVPPKFVAKKHGITMNYLYVIASREGVSLMGKWLGKVRGGWKTVQPKAHEMTDDPYGQPCRCLAPDGMEG